MRITLRYILPLAIFTMLVGLLCWSLLITSKEKQEDVIAQQSFSASSQNTMVKGRRDFRLKSLIEPNKILTQNMFTGKVTILNVWASWCGPCRAGQETLMHLSKQSDSIFWVGLNINDKADEAQRMLQIYGNPYQDVIFDPEGRLAINLGIRGTPALLVLDKKGSVQYRHYGPINATIWQEEILPIIKDLEEG